MYSLPSCTVGCRTAVVFASPYRHWICRQRRSPGRTNFWNILMLMDVVQYWTSVVLLPLEPQHMPIRLTSPPWIISDHPLFIAHGSHAPKTLIISHSGSGDLLQIILYHRQTVGSIWPCIVALMSGEHGLEAPRTM